MTSLGTYYRIKKINNVSGGGNPANPIEFKLPNEKFLVFDCYLGIKLTHDANKDPAGKKTTVDTDLSKKYAPDNKYKDQKKLYELIEYLQIYAGNNCHIDISGKTALDFITETMDNQVPPDFEYNMIGREKISEDYRLIKIPWLTIGSGGNLVFLGSYKANDFKIVLQYNVDKTGFNRGTQNFPYIINETSLFIGGYEFSKSPMTSSKNEKRWLSITNKNLELNNLATSHEVELVNVGSGELLSIKLINKVDERTYFKSIELTKDLELIVPRLPLNVINRMSPLASMGVYSKPNNVIANFDFKTNSYGSNKWDSTFNTLKIFPNDRFRMRFESLKAEHTKKENIDVIAVIVKLVEDTLLEKSEPVISEIIED